MLLAGIGELMRDTSASMHGRIDHISYSVQPGDWLAQYLASHGISEGGCQCTAVKNLMNSWGPERCAENIDALIDKLRQSLEQWRRNHKAHTLSEMLIKLLDPPDSMMRHILLESIDASRKSSSASAAGVAPEQEITRLLEYMRGPYRPQPARWNLSAAAQAAQARLIDAHRQTYIYPRWNRDQGIVIIGGGKYFAASYLLVLALRELGCQLPIELWYFGRHELDHRCESLMAAHAVACRNLDDIPMRVRSGWNAKIAAISHSDFKEVLYLDSDIIPVHDPEYLFRTDEFRSLGTIFWPDLLNIHGYDIEASAFAVMGLRVPGRNMMPEWSKPSDYRPLESGQLLIDRERCQRAIDLCRLLCDQSDFWFPQTPASTGVISGPSGGRGQYWYCYGDKSLFLLSWMRAGALFYMAPQCEWFGDRNGGGFSQKDPAGRIIFQHRCQPTTKLRVNADNSANGLINPELFRKLEKRVKHDFDGHLWRWRDHGERDTVVAHELSGSAYVPTGLDIDWLELLNGGQTQAGKSLRSGRYEWRIVHDADTPIMVLQSAHQVAFLKRDERHIWRNDAICLYPAPPARVSCHRDSIDLSVYGEIMANDYRLPQDLRGKSIVDLGAHCGFFTLECVRRGASRILALEPYPDNYRHLATNVRDLPRVTAWQAAIWSRTGLVNIAKWNSHVGHQIRQDERKHLTVPCLSLSDIIQHAAPADILKMDIEGAEWVIFATWPELGLPYIIGEYHLAESDYWSRIVGEQIDIAYLERFANAHGYALATLPNANDERVGLFWMSR